MNEKTTAEFEIMVSGGRIVVDNLPLKDGKYRVWAVPSAQKEVFKKVEASKLSLDDDFMKYEPKTEVEKNFKNLVEAAIKNGLKDFWRPKYDPSFDDKGRICYEPGEVPAAFRDYHWWKCAAGLFNPELKSRLGTRTEYISFLAVLIKELVASGKTVEWSWNAVCNDSKELGHYKDSENAKDVCERTGSREVCGFYDLANLFKILVDDTVRGGFWSAGGHSFYKGSKRPLVSMTHYAFYLGYDHSSTGWLVFDQCPV